MSYVKFEVPGDLVKKTLELLEVVRASREIGGKIVKGTNEVTKFLERGDAKLVVIAEDVSPPEIVMHLPMICEEKQIPYTYVKTKEDLGSASGIGIPTASVAIISAGEPNKMLLKEVAEKAKNLAGKK